MVKHRKRKTKNPFKMWGSWTGAVILTFLPILGVYIGNQIEYPMNFLFYFYYIQGKTAEFLTCDVFNLCFGGEFAGASIAILITGILSLILGFLIGWGVQSNWRKL